MKRLMLFVLATLLLILPAAAAVQPDQKATASMPAGLLCRHYREGETLSYHMRASNTGFFSTLTYEADVIGVVKKDCHGRFFEEYSWTNLVLNNRKIALPADASTRQSTSLDFNSGFPGFPDPLKANPHLHAPMLDFFNFYVDLQLATRLKNLANAGDHVFLKYSKPASWAHGSVILGEDSIDFDITLKELDQTHQYATLLVRHVPSQKPEIKIPAAWMNVPVADTANNWVQVSKDENYKLVEIVIGGACVLALFVLLCKWNSPYRRRMVRTAFFSVAGLLVLCVVIAPYFHYMAMVGKETFDCEIKVSLADGKIISATMDNPVEVLARPCANDALTSYGPAFRGHFKRRIEIYQKPSRPPHEECDLFE